MKMYLALEHLRKNFLDTFSAVCEERNIRQSNTASSDVLLGDGRYHQRRMKTMPYDVPQLLKMTQAQLDELFTKSPTGEIPDGEGKGTAIVAPGTTYTQDIAQFVSHFAWQGKVFDAKKGVLKNRILPFGLNAIIAKVYKAPSWLDNKECIVLDYSETSLVAHWIRDEIRQIGPKMYLGKVYWDKKRLIDFVLEF
jgi:hypothetical protein